MSTARDTSVEGRLRDALAEFAKDTEDPDRTFSRENCRKTLSAAGIELTDRRLDIAAKVFGQMAFYGGNYTLDARRILRALLRTEDES